MATDLDTDRQRLELLIADQMRRRRPVPCVQGDVLPSAAWTSDDPATQQFAARACLDCTAFLQCQQYATAYPAEAGVLGGLTELDRRPKRGRPAKTTQTKGSER